MPKYSQRRGFYGPGLPDNAPNPQSEELDKVEVEAVRYMNGDKATRLKTKNWTTHHWLYFFTRPKTQNGHQPNSGVGQCVRLIK